MGSALKVGEEILFNMTAHMEAKKKKQKKTQKTMEGNAVRFPWDMLSKKKAGKDITEKLIYQIFILFIKDFTVIF